ncbi:MAG TPA: hypothetical protein VET23_15200 [Chitinophagaceae bacterium]|nr:hypothetical protein [Chitinophagaceae bacterium]
MKKIYGFVIALLLFSSAVSLNAQSPCSNVTAITFSNVSHYYGIRVSVSQTYGADITVTGYIYDDFSGANFNNPFTLTITEGNLSAETSASFFQSSEYATSATVIIDNVNPCYPNPDSFDANFSHIGSLHNAFLANALDNFTIPGSTISYDSAINSVMLFNKSFFQSNEYSYFGETQSSDITDQECTYAKLFANAPDFNSKLLSGSDSVSLDSAKIKIGAASYVDAANKALFNRIVEVTRQSLNGNISSSVLKDSLVALENVWTDINQASPGQGSELTGNILAIGEKSCEFWISNADSLYDEDASIIYPREMIVGGPNEMHSQSNSDFYFAIPIATDIAGAIFGAVGSAINQYVNNGTVHWGGVATGAVLGAVTGSTGIVGRIGRWIKSLF